MVEKIVTGHRLLLLEGGARAPGYSAEDCLLNEA